MIKNIWAFILAGIIAVFTFFGIRIGNFPPVETTTATTTAVSSSQAEPAIPAFSITVNLPGESPITFTNISAVDAGLTVVTMEMFYSNSVGSETTAEYTGLRIKDILAFLGVNMAELSAEATLTVGSGPTFTRNYAREYIVSDKTLLSWLRTDMVVVDGVTGGTTTTPSESMLPPRLCPGDSTSSGNYVSAIDTITLNIPA